MRRIGNWAPKSLLLAVCATFALTGAERYAGAQEPSPPGSEPAPPGNEPAAPGANEPAAPGTEPTPPGAPAPAETATGPVGSISWRDIVTVPRRPILKYHRVEI